MRAAVATQALAVNEQLVQCRRLAHVLGLTRDMLLHAERDEWERVTELELERREDLSICFSNAVGELDSLLVAEAIAALLHLNEELMAKLKSAREVVMRQGIEQVRTRSAIGSYREVNIAR